MATSTLTSFARAGEVVSLSTPCCDTHDGRAMETLQCVLMARKGYKAGFQAFRDPCRRLSHALSTTQIDKMKLHVWMVVAAMVSGGWARVVPLEQAPYARSAVAPALEPRAGSYANAVESALHNRIARHIRPDYSPLFKRQAAADNGAIADFGSSPPQPVRGSKGAPFLHGSNTDIDRQNVDYLSPPPTDAGTVPNLKWAFSLSKSKLLNGGWVREQVVTDLPASKEVAAAEQRLAPYAYSRTALAPGGRMGSRPQRHRAHHGQRRGGPQLRRRCQQGRSVELAAWRTSHASSRTGGGAVSAGV
ncbi:hypothetical protein L1887_48184 [Cichorium endivia]|nr:hypothetical protein L1887_48184 [Cichorium endivia]